MFRKPREIAAPIASETPIRPSTGRPPTPPSSKKQSVQTSAALTTYNMASPTSTPLRGKSKILPKRTPLAIVGKARGKANGNANIMNFFKKTESHGNLEARTKEEDDSLFVAAKSSDAYENAPTQTPTPPRDETFPYEIEFPIDDSPKSRYNEDSVPIKRRKIDDTATKVLDPFNSNIPGALKKGPFADDSDSNEDTGAGVKGSKQVIRNDWAQEEEDTPTNKLDFDKEEQPGLGASKETSEILEKDRPSEITLPLERRLGEKASEGIRAPRLKRENTSVGGANDFDDIDDFIDDEFAEEGEEYLERRWMEEQEEIGFGLGDDDPGRLQEPEEPAVEVQNQAAVGPGDAASSICPICRGNTAGLTEQVSRRSRR